MTNHDLIKFYLEYSKNLSRVKDIAIELLDGNSADEVFANWSEVLTKFHNRNKDVYK